MADTKTTELQTQLDLQNQINQVLQGRMGILKAQEKALTSQVQLAIDMCKALKCEELDEVGTRLDNVRKEMEKAAAAASDMSEELDTAAEGGIESTTRLGNSFEEVTKKVNAQNGAVVGLAAGIVRGFGSAFQTITNLATGVGGLVSTFFNLGTSIVGLPFKLLDNLLGLAQSSSGGSPSPVRLELENIRKEFGDLSTATGKVAASSLAQFRKEAGNLGGTGLALRRIYGSGPEGLAKAMAENLELMKALGPAVDNFSDILEKNAGPLAAFRRGLGLSAEQQAEFMKSAQSIGKDPMKAMNEFASQAINMGDKFGISAKLITKDMAEMNADVANFGTLGPKAFSQISVYARKLGVEVKALTGLISAFDDFESAAQGAAKLSQAFGMNVDAMKMMQEQDPAARLSMLQKSLKDTGKSFEQMNRSEQKLLASQAGLDESTAKIAFSQRGMSMSYDQVQKEGDKASKKQLTQEQIMTKLAKSIERVLESMQSTQFESFFDAFAKGFTSGIMKSKEFKEAMRAISQALLLVFRGGVQVGKMFVKFFPGIKEMLGGIRSIFSPDEFRKMMEGVKEAFGDFFKDLQKDPKAGVEKFLDRFKKLFKEFFSSTGPGIKTLAEGGKMFMKALGGIFKAVLPMVLDGLISAIKAITEILKAPPGMPDAVSELFVSLGKSMMELISTLWERLAPALGEMFSVLFEKVKPYLMKAGAVILGVVFAKVIITSLLTALSGSLVGFVGKKIAEFFGLAAAAGAGGENNSKTISELTADIKNSVIEFADGMKEAFKKLSEISAAQIVKAAGLFFLVTVTFVPTIILLVLGLKKIVQMVTLKEALSAIAAIVALGSAIKAVGEMIGILEKVDASLIKKGIMGALAAAAFLLTGIVVIALAVRMIQRLFSGIDWEAFALGMASIATTLTAIATVVLATTFLDKMKGLMMQALIGLAVAGLFLGAIALFVYFIPPLADRFKGINWEEFATAMAATAVVFASLLIAIGAAVLIGLLGEKALLAVVGLGILALFVVALIEAVPPLIEAQRQLSSASSGLDPEPWIAISKIFGSLALAALAATAVGLVATFAIISLPILSAFVWALTYSSDIGFGVLPMLSAFSTAAEDKDFNKIAVAFVKLAVIFTSIAVIAASAVAAGIFAAPGAVALLPIGLFLASLIMSEGDVGFLPTFRYMSKAINGIEFGKLELAFLKLAVIFWSITAIASAAIGAGLLAAIGTIALLPIGLFLAALVFSSGNVGFIPTFKYMTKAIAGIDFGKLAIAFAALATIFAAIAIIGTIAVSAGIASILGLLFITPIAAFLAALALVFIPAMAAIGLLSKDIEFGAVLKLFGTLVLVFGAVILIATELIVLIPLAIGATVGIIALGAFLLAASVALLPLIPFIAVLRASKAGEAIDDIKGFILVLAAVAEMAAIALLLAPFAAPIVGTYLLATFNVIDKLKTAIETKITPFMAAVGQMNLDPSTFKTKLEALGQLFSLIGPLTQAATSLAQSGSGIFDKSNAAKTLNAANQFVNSVIGGVERMISALTSVDFTEAQLSAAIRIGEALKPIGELIKAITPSPELMNAIKDSSWFNNKTTERMRTLTTHMVTMLDTIKNNVGPLFDKIKEASDKITNPQEFEPKIRSLGIAFGVLSTFARILTDVTKSIKEMTGEDDDLNDGLEMFKKVIKSITESLFSGDTSAFKKAFDGINDITKGITDAPGMEAKVKVVASMFDIIGKFASMIGQVAALMPKDEKEVENPRKFADKLRDLTGPNGLIPSVLNAIMGTPGITSVFNSLLVLMNALPATNERELKQVETRGKILGGMFDVLSKFSSAMSTFADFGKQEKGKIDPSKIGSLLNTIYGVLFNQQQGGKSIGGTLQWITSGLIDLISGPAKKLVGKERQIKALGESFKALGDFATAIKTLSDLGFKENPDAVKKTMENISKTFGDSGYQNNIKDALKGMSDIVSKSAGFTNNAGSIKTLISYVKSFNELTDRIKNMSDINTGVVERANNVHEAITKMKSDLASLRDTEGGKLVVDIAKGLSKSGTVTVKTQLTNINLAVDIKMSAEQIGKGVITWSDGATPSPANGKSRRFVTINRANDTVPDNLNAEGVGVRG